MGGAPTWQQQQLQMGGGGGGGGGSGGQGDSDKGASRNRGSRGGRNKRPADMPPQGAPQPPHHHHQAPVEAAAAPVPPLAGQTGAFPAAGASGGAKPKPFNQTALQHQSTTRFGDLEVHANTKRAIAEVFGYEFCTKVQAQSLPFCLSGNDVLAKAKTGTGKTLAFMIPAIENVSDGAMAQAFGQQLRVWASSCSFGRAVMRQRLLQQSRRVERGVQFQRTDGASENLQTYRRISCVAAVVCVDHWNENVCSAVSVVTFADTPASAATAKKAAR
eukprot:276530-Chlamydomonas_euryale.AAC.1